MQFSPGMILDNCRLLARVGAGACGTVWQAENIVSGEWEALKILSGGGLAERELRALKLYRELNHPALIRIRHIGQAEDTFFYTMDWCESTLAERKVTPDELVVIARKLAEGLALLHARGLLHRDIKPANIFFRHGDPVLGDIGLLTQQEGATFAGSPGFLSPDILSGKSSASPYSDCYALGKSIYCALSGLGPEQFPCYSGEMTPAASLLMRAVMAVCSRNPAICTAAEFLSFLEHPAVVRKRKIIPISACIAIILGLAAGTWLYCRKTTGKKNSPEEEKVRVLPQKAKIPETKKIPVPVPDTALSVKTDDLFRQYLYEDFQKKYSALPANAAEKLWKLQCSHSVHSVLLGRTESMKITPESMRKLLVRLNPEQQKIYQECCAKIFQMRTTEKWRKLEKLWSSRQFNYYDVIRKKEAEQKTDSLNAIRQLEKQDPLLALKARQGECRKIHWDMVNAENVSRFELFIRAAEEYCRAFWKVRTKDYR